MSPSASALSSASSPERQASSKAGSAAAASRPQQQQQQQRARDGGSDGSGDEGLTAAMRDRQARGKDLYKSDESDGDDGDGVRVGRGLRAEPFEDRERRAFALAVLDSPEQLMMYAQSANDTIPSQRRQFRAMFAGFEPLPASCAAEAGGPEEPPPPARWARQGEAPSRGRRRVGGAGRVGGLTAGMTAGMTTGDDDSLGARSGSEGPRPLLGTRGASAFSCVH